MKARIELSLVAIAALAMGCSSSSGEGSGTTGKAVALRSAVSIPANLAAPATNALGWSITVSKAYLSVGALYYFQGDPVLSRRDQHQGGPGASRWAWLQNWFERPAYAHPGHYIEGDAMGQMTTAAVIDLLGGPVVLAPGTGVTGMVNSARFTWQSPPAGDLAPALAGHVVLAVGTAAKGQDLVHFLATADQGDVLNGNGRPEVDGCTFGAAPGQVGVEVQSDGLVTLTLAPSVWFDEVDFSYVFPVDQGLDGGAGVGLDAGAEAGSEAGPSDEGGPSTADAAALSIGSSGGPRVVGSIDTPLDIRGTTAWKGFARGVKKGTAYLFSYSK